MSRPSTPDHSQHVGPKELHNAERRAENAERRVEQLEHRLETFEEQSSQPHGYSSSALNAGTASSSDFKNDEDGISALRNEPMMDHLLNALGSGKDIGHYGRLVFAMVAHHFLPEESMIQWLTKDPRTNPEEATALLRQVEGRDYSPPRRDRILAWQSEQEFAILPNSDDPDCGNVYRNLKFPQSVYDHIQEYQEEKAQAEAADSR